VRAREAIPSEIGIPSAAPDPTAARGENRTRDDAVQSFRNRYSNFTFGNTPMNASEPRFGFVAFAETWNGRLAMLGFVIGLATELLTGQGILSQIGLG
jgi:hypothetical protein